MEKLSKKQKKIEKKDKIWLEKYGVKFSECVPPKPEKHKKKEKSYFKKLVPLFQEFKGKWIFSFILGIVIAIIAIIEPYSWQKIIDNLTTGNFEAVLWFIALYAGGLIIIRLFRHLHNNMVNDTYNGMVCKLREETTKKILKTEVQKFTKTSSGEILNKINYATSNFSAGCVNIFDLLTTILQNVVFLAYAFIINIYLGLILIGVGLFHFITDSIFAKKFERVYQERYYAVDHKKNNLYTEMIRGITDVKALNTGATLFEKAKKYVKFAYNQSISQSHTYQHYLTIRTIGNTILIGGFLVLSVFFIQNAIVTIGGALVLFMYLGNIKQLFEDVGELLVSIEEQKIHGKEIYGILDNENYKPEKFGTIALKNVEGKIEFKNVKFSYDETQPLFENLNLTINPNECVGFVGKSGQGKSTIMNLITRFYDLAGGKILLDGKDVKTLTEDSLRNSISVVSQNPYIFNDTIKGNLLLAKEDATDEEIVSACKLAYIHDFIMALPQKYDAIVGEGGITLSGGQRQRLALARAFLKNSKIILLDEATSALDNESQEEIKKAIKQMQKTKTILLVAHRLTTVKDCDKIYVIENGQIVGEGPHQELIKSCEAYKNLYKNEENNQPN